MLWTLPASQEHLRVCEETAPLPRPLHKSLRLALSTHSPASAPKLLQEQPDVHCDLQVKPAPWLRG